MSKQVTITAWLPTDPTNRYTEFFRAQVPLFQQANEKIKVNHEPPGAADKLEAAVVSGDPPDIQQSNYIPMFAWAKRGALEVVDPYLDKRGKSDYFDWARDGSSIDGKLYEWPWMMNSVGLIANKSMLAEKSATNLLPAQGTKSDWTFDQWKAVLKAMTALSGDPDRDIYGSLFLLNNTVYYEMMYLWGNGAELYDKDEKNVVVCSPQGIEALQMLVDLIYRDRIATAAPDAQFDTAKMADLFYRKRLGIIAGAPSTIGDVDRRVKDGSIVAPFEAVFLPPPHAPGKTPATFVAVQSFLVFKQAKDKDRTIGAMRFGHYLTDNDVQKAIKPIGELPVRKSVGNIYSDDINRTTALAGIDHARSIGRFPDNTQIRTLWSQAVTAAFTKQRPAKDALEEMCRLSVPIMAKNV